MTIPYYCLVPRWSAPNLQSQVLISQPHWLPPPITKMYHQQMFVFIRCREIHDNMVIGSITVLCILVHLLLEYQQRHQTHQLWPPNPGSNSILLDASYNWGHHGLPKIIHFKLTSIQIHSNPLTHSQVLCDFGCFPLRKITKGMTWRDAANSCDTCGLEAQPTMSEAQGEHTRGMQGASARGDL